MLHYLLPIINLLELNCPICITESCTTRCGVHYGVDCGAWRPLAASLCPWPAHISLALLHTHSEDAKWLVQLQDALRRGLLHVEGALAVLPPPGLRHGAQQDALRHLFMKLSGHT